MREIAITAAIVAAIFAAGALLSWVPWRVSLVAGAWLVAVGLGAGVPAGAVYHALLRRALLARGALPKGWIWRPIGLNRELTTAERRRVMPWCWIGGAGFFAVVAGQLLVVAGMGAALIQGP